MKKKLLLTGYGGFVAGSVAWHARKDWEVHAISRKKQDRQNSDLSFYAFDLRDTEQLRSVFELVRPDAVIHTAALANIDYCQAHPEEAEAINVGVTTALASLCGKSNTRMIFCSTDSVFDGIKGNYVEEDAPNPLNIYAETKMKAEQLVMGTSGNAMIARLSLVMGLSVLGTGNSFLAKMIASLEAGKEAVFPENEIRTPVDVITLGRALLELASLDCTGFVHLAGNTRLNRYKMAQDIARRLGLPEELVTATDSNSMPGRAKRPNDASLNNTKAKKLLTTPMRSLDEALDLVLEVKKEQQDARD